MAFFWLYSVTICIFAVQGSLIPRLRSTEETAPASYQKTGWIDERRTNDPQRVNEICKTTLRVINSRRYCLLKCLSVLKGVAIQKTKTAIQSKVPGWTEEDLFGCVHARCLHPGDRIQKECLLNCISGTCHTTGFSNTEPAQTMSAEREDTTGEMVMVPSSTNEMGNAEVLVKAEKERRYGIPLTRSLKKRGYTDATDICIAFHCSHKPRGTLGFLKCVYDNRCNG